MAMFGHLLHVCEQLARRVAPSPRSHFSASSTVKQQLRKEKIKTDPSENNSQQPLVRQPTEVKTDPSTADDSRTEVRGQPWRLRLSGWLRRPGRGGGFRQEDNTVRSNGLHTDSAASARGGGGAISTRGKGRDDTCGGSGGSCKSGQCKDKTKAGSSSRGGRGGTGVGGPALTGGGRGGGGGSGAQGPKEKGRKIRGPRPGERKITGDRH
jgi:hypothetical protein